MTVYVSRDQGGAITSVNRLPQPGLAEESIDDSAPEVVAFQAGPTSAEQLDAARSQARALITAGSTADQIGNRGVDVAGWTDANTRAEGVWAALCLVCQRAGVAIPTAAEVSAQVAANRLAAGLPDPGVTPDEVADRYNRRLQQTEIVPQILATLDAKLGDPIPGT